MHYRYGRQQQETAYGRFQQCALSKKEKSTFRSCWFEQKQRRVRIIDIDIMLYTKHNFFICFVSACSTIQISSGCFCIYSLKSIQLYFITCFKRIASSKFSEPMRFVWRLNIVEEKYIQEQQPN